jgi:hypothetical protein
MFCRQIFIEKIIIFTFTFQILLEFTSISDFSEQKHFKAKEI